MKALIRKGKDSLPADFVNFQVNARKRFGNMLKAGTVMSWAYDIDVIFVRRPINVTPI